MIDVVFLLLTFFIYSLVMMIRAEVLPVRLTTLSAGAQAPIRVAGVAAITIDRHGELFLDRQPVSAAALDAALRRMAGQPQPPRLYVAMEEQGEVDRGPLLLDVIQRVRGAGLSDFAFVGPPPR